MQISSKIDWLTLTRTYSKHPLGNATMTRWGAESLASDIIADLCGTTGRLIVGKPQRFYAYTFEDALTGANVAISEDLFQQGVRVTLSGSALAKHGFPDDLLRAALLAEWKVTRIDLAIDWVGCTSTVGLIAAAYEDRNGENKRRSWSSIHSPDGETLYVGSRKSARMLRVYDKGAEQKKPDMNWVRFEMEFKDYAAPEAAERWLADRGFAYAQVLDMLALGDTDITAPLAEIAEGYKNEVISAPKTESKRVLWFKSQVLSAFTKIVLDDPLEALECAMSLEETLLDAYQKWMDAL